MRNWLVLAAHPDDEVLGCGGTISRLTKDGHDVYVAIMGEGITSRYDKREQANLEIVGEIKELSLQVSTLLGVKELFLYDFPDNRFDTVPLLDIVKTIENLINRLQPQVVYTHHGGDLNIDHVITHRAVLTATRPVFDCPIKEIHSFEVPSATEWAFGQFRPSFQPNVFVDISTTLEMKIQAMQLYESEMQFFPYPRSPEAICAIAHRWGSVAGREAAEAFELVRSIR